MHVPRLMANHEERFENETASRATCVVFSVRLASEMSWISVRRGLGWLCLGALPRNRPEAQSSTAGYFWSSVRVLPCSIQNF